MAASPIFQQIGFRFGVRAYVLMGAVGENACGRSGELIVEFVGPPQAVGDAVNWLEERGARIERLGAQRGEPFGNLSWRLRSTRLALNDLPLSGLR